MVMQSSYPDYNKISELLKEIEKTCHRQRETGWHYFELESEIKQLLRSEPVQVAGKSCQLQFCEGGAIYYPGKVHHLDGDLNNESFGNLAMVCPKCQAHILLSRFSPEDLWLLKVRGLSNAEIGRILGMSRERVRQICRKYEAGQLTPSKSNIDDLVERMELREKGLIASGKLKRKMDKRTLRKRILAELAKMEGEQKKGGKP